jgi:hypothetical protein
MKIKTNQQVIEYSPTIAGRTAKIVIPALQTALPPKTYKFIYDLLYKNYKRILHKGYYFKVLINQLFGNARLRLKTLLTYKLLPYSMGGRKALENAFAVVFLAEERKVEGALLECGVAEGGTAAMMALASQALGEKPRQKWFFDSYEGLPEPTIEDYQGGKTGNFIRPLPKGACLGTIEQVSGLMFDSLGLSRDQVHLVKGWFQDTVPEHRKEVGPIAVLRLDGDWYESTKIPLENFFDQITPGGFVIIDDYATCFGSRKAVDEFRTKRNLTTPLLQDGRGGVWFEKPKND